MKEVEDENALKHMFDKAYVKRTADALVAAYPALTSRRDLFDVDLSNVMSGVMQTRDLTRLATRLKHLESLFL